MLSLLIATMLTSADETAAQLFERNCSSCHVPPDPRFATDRAWIHQLSETT